MFVNYLNLKNNNLAQTKNIRLIMNIGTTINYYYIICLEQVITLLIIIFFELDNYKIVLMRKHDFISYYITIFFTFYISATRLKILAGLSPNQLCSYYFNK